MIKVRCISNWADSYPLHKRIISQFAPDYELQNDIRFVDDNSYDYLVIFNAANGFKSNVPKERTLGFIQEPHDHFRYYDNNLHRQCNIVYTCSDAANYGNRGNYVSAPATMFYSMHQKIDELLQNKDFNKPHKLSIVVSGINTPNTFYNKRHEVLRLILDSDLDCHIYGRGLNLKDSRYKGSPDNKADALLPYEYSIAIENGRWNGYISEKYFDCILCNTIPIYLGAPDVKKYFKLHFDLPDINDTFIESLKGFLLMGGFFRTEYSFIDAKKQWHENHNIFKLIKDFVHGN